MIQNVTLEYISGKSYREVWDYQHEIHHGLIARKVQAKADGTALTNQPHQLLLCEHAPVFTLGRSGDVENLLLNQEQLEARHIEYFPINRGGDITYHGTGQITGYPILDLDLFFNDVHKYVRNLEEVVIRVLAEYGLIGGRIAGYTGVWLTNENGTQHRKICAIGVHLSRWVTLHGFAFNVNTDLAYFDYIVPCGIVDPDKTVTSLHLELGHEVPLREVNEKYVKHFEEVFGCSIIEPIKVS